jgi:cytochrome c
MRRTAIAIAAMIVTTGGALAQDLALGEQLFADRCAPCHAVGDEAAKNGPSLNNVINRPAASVEGFKYGPAMVEAGQAGVIWDLDTLTKFITKPRTVVNGSNMSFTGLREPADVANVIAYLATFSPPPQ